jgi:hypothetical protein
VKTTRKETVSQSAKRVGSLEEEASLAENFFLSLLLPEQNLAQNELRHHLSHFEFAEAAHRHDSGQDNL